MKLSLECPCLSVILLVGLVLFSPAGLPARAEVQVVGPQASDQDLCGHSLRDPDAGIPACTRLIDADRDGRGTVGFFNNRGVAKIAKGDLESAIKDFTNALDRSPNFVDGFRNRGLAYHLYGDFDSAIADFNRAIKLSDKSAALYNARGASLVKKEEVDPAIKDFDRALKLDASFANAYYNRGQAWFLQKQFARAITDLDAYINRIPKDPKGYIQRGDARVNMGDFTAAIADYGTAIDIDPKNAEAYSHRGEALRLRGDLAQAIADHDKAIGLDPNPEAYVNRALTRHDQGKGTEAIADCSEAILLAPKYDLAYANRGRFRRLAGDLQASLIDLDKAVELSPHSFRALSFRGDTLLARGDSARALADFNEALNIAPDFVAAYTGRGQTYEMLGDRLKAKADFAKAISLPAVADASLAKPAQDRARTRLAAIETEENAAKLQLAQQRDVQGRADAEKTKESDRERKRLEQLERDRLEKQKEIARLKDELSKRTLATQPAPSPQDPGRRVALVIGNSNYTSVAALPNPQRDADAVAAALRRVGFQTVIARNNLSREAFVDELKNFKDAARDADWAVIYYAGHGIQVGGKNYLIPVDAKLRDSDDVRVEAIDLETVQEYAQRARKLHLVMLDSCRDNPFLAGMRVANASRSISRGFARIEPENATLVAYAAKDGQVALDGDGEHSPFTAAFLKYVDEPRLPIDKLFRKVRDDVQATTRGKQLPFTYGSLPGSEDFYFKVN